MLSSSGDSMSVDEDTVGAKFRGKDLVDERFFGLSLNDYV